MWCTFLADLQFVVYIVVFKSTCGIGLIFKTFANWTIKDIPVFTGIAEIRVSSTCFAAQITVSVIFLSTLVVEIDRILAKTLGRVNTLSILEN